MKILQSPDLRAVIVLTLLWIVFFWRLLTPIAEDQASFKQGDFSGQFVAFGAYQYDRMSNGEIPLWNPYNNGGLPFIADTQAAVFYPPRLLTIAIASLTSGWTYHVLELEAIFHVLAYSLMMYAFVRRLTSSVWGGFIAAIVAAYGGFVSGYPPLQLALLEAAIWLPLCALCILEATSSTKIKWFWIMLAGVALGVSWLAGHPQTSWFLTYVMVAWLAYRVYLLKAGWSKLLLSILLMGLITVGTTAVTFFPALEYLTFTVRSGLGFDAKGNGFPYQDIIQFIFPSSVSVFSPLYVGIPALILTFMAVYYVWKKSQFWFVVAIFSLLISFGSNSVLYHALYNVLPGLRFFRGQERTAFLIANSLAILAGIGMSYLVTWSATYSRQAIHRFMLILLSIIGGLTALIYIAWWGNVGNGFDNIISTAALSTIVIIIAYGLFMWQVRQADNRYSLLLITTLVIFELFSVNMDAESNYDPIPASEQLSLSAPEIVQSTISDTLNNPYRVDGFRGLEANYGSLYQVMDIRGISPLFLESPWQIIYRDYINNPRAWEIFAVRYIFSERDSFNQVETDIISEGNDSISQVFVHQLVNTRPFAHFVYDYALVGSDGHAIELLFDPNFPVRDTVILQQEPTIDLPEDIPNSQSVSVIEFTPEVVTIEANTSENALLSLAMVDYIGWEARINGEASPILRAYGSLMAIEIPAGQHMITLTYNPLSYRIGAIFSLLTWASVIVVTLIWFVKNMLKQVQETP